MAASLPKIHLGDKGRGPVNCSTKGTYTRQTHGGALGQATGLCRACATVWFIHSEVNLIVLSALYKLTS